jgi:DNA (cytosine-5)-methyltransferase 1
VRAGLPNWACLFANDVDKLKGWSYADNWGRGVLRVGDIATLKVSDLPAIPVGLSWSSSPCQDLSLAGTRAGLSGSRSRVFWDWWGLTKGLCAIGCAPRIVCLENVCGLATSNRGADLALVRRAFEAADYDTAITIIDARNFVPQSRPRLFVVGAQKNLGVDIASLVDQATKALPICAAQVVDILIPGLPFHTPLETAEVLASMTAVNLAKVAEMRQAGQGVVRTYLKRVRRDVVGNIVSEVEVRNDELSGALRTAKGGSSIEGLVAIRGR